MLGYPGYLTHEHFPKAGPLIQWLHRLPRTPEHTPVEEIQQGSIFSVSTNLPRPLDSSTTRITSANRSAFIGSMDFSSCTGCCSSKSSRFDCLELPTPVLLFDFVTVHHASVNLSLPPPRTVCKLGSGDWELSLEDRVPSPGEAHGSATWGHAAFSGRKFEVLSFKFQASSATAVTPGSTDRSVGGCRWDRRGAWCRGCFPGWGASRDPTEHRGPAWCWIRGCTRPRDRRRRR